MIGFLGARATPGVELVEGGRYWRTLAVGEARGTMGVAFADGEMSIDVSRSLVPVSGAVLNAVRDVFDLDADIELVESVLRVDPVLARSIGKRPGLRVPGSVNGFEIAIRAVLGQQVSVRGASTLAGRLADATGEPLVSRSETLLEGAPAALTRLAATPEGIAEAGVDRIAACGLPRARAACIVGLAIAAASGALGSLNPLARANAERDVPEYFERLLALPGIGPWTAQYIAMRALRWSDAFPDGDLALRKAAGGITAAELHRRATRWKPWRAYAAMHLWASLSDGAT
ncbi:MAG: hypothetical protein M3081_19345 [Gemmatimonadota bacterium]|nr:hypothetical protein [Gemmatimonadota bacterium]